MLESLWNLLAGVLSSVWGLIASVVAFVCDMAVWLHVEAPRLEGLLVGVLLAWLLTRRDSHPLIRVLSAPLKLVLDILDLAWDQVLDVGRDVWQTATGWAVGSVSWVTSNARNAYTALMSKLRSTKESLKKED